MVSNDKRTGTRVSGADGPYLKPGAFFRHYDHAEGEKDEGAGNMFDRVIALLDECKSTYEARNAEHGEMFEAPLFDAESGRDARQEILRALIFLKRYRSNHSKTHKARHDSTVDTICYIAMLEAVESEKEEKCTS